MGFKLGKLWVFAYMLKWMEILPFCKMTGYLEVDKISKIFMLTLEIRNFLPINDFEHNEWEIYNPSHKR
jgi:hypothetical protein